jgi:hypothetical protein
MRRGTLLAAFWLMFLGAVISSGAATTAFTFVLDEPCKTSAGVYAPDGTLVRTLWSKVRYAAGTNTAVWDGFDDNTNAVPAGTYQIRILQHNTEYVWDGAVGNSSAEISGPTVHRGFWPMRDMAISGTNAFYVSGYNEGMYDFRSFATTDPQHVKMSWYWVYSAQFNRNSSASGDVNDLNWLWTAADSNRVYFACSGTPNPANLTVPNSYPGCIVACYVSNNAAANFTSGGQIVNNGANSPLPNGIHVGTQPGLSGLSVQNNGNLLAASVRPDNRVYLVDKISGSAVNNFTVSSPGRLNFSPDGSLWVISGTSVVCYTNLGLNPTAAVTITNFSQPMDVAVNPQNANLILVADGGASQQVKAFNNSGAPLWTYGLAGGYQANGAAVATNKFWFFDGENPGTFLCFSADGSFWVGDGGNHRALHFSPALNYLEQIMYQPHSYVACVDQNNPSRVFNGFLEFSVDYNRPLSQAWTLVKNWKANVDPCHISWNEGLREVTTFTNGHTYAYCDNSCYNNVVQELCELGTNQLRFTGIFPMITNQGRWMSLGPDGSARATQIGVANWYHSTLKGFDASNNPVWYPETLLASAPSGGTDPVPRCCSFGNVRETISTNNIVISFDQTLNNGWHLGGVRVGATNWLWKTSHSVPWMDGLGTFENANGVQYPGNTVQAVDRQVMFGYHGEFFRNEGQASQHMHFYDDGLFVGQFGEASPGHSPYEGALPGFAGNADSPSLIKTTNGDYYVWVNDEAGHGPMRWHFVNAKNIRELTGSGPLGGAITVTNPAPTFPTGLTARNGNQRAELAWQPVPGAASYNLRYSLMNGGPYNTVAANTKTLDYTVGGLTNGLTYYFVVTALAGRQEGTTSEQVEVHPFDTSQNAIAVGHMDEGGQFNPYLETSSAAAAASQPSFVCAEQMTSLLSLRELCYYGYGNLMDQSVGCKGYVIYGWGGAGSALSTVAAGYAITPGSGWADVQYLERQFRADTVLGSNHGVTANLLGVINISVSDTNYHFLTVVSPSQFNDARSFALRLASGNQNPAVFNINESPGLTHTFQFLFKGNVTLTADATGGASANVQALFLDDAPVTYSPPSSAPLVLMPPSGFHIGP